MKTHDFALVVISSKELDADGVCDLANQLFEAGAEDCTVGSSGKNIILEFDREADSYQDAVLSAIQEVKTINDIEIKSLDAGQFVGLSDAAEMSNLTRAALSSFSKGTRGDGTFPTPYLRVSSKSPLYDWAEIADWLEARGYVEHGIADNARFTSQINMALKLKHGSLGEVTQLVSLI
ncbi:hypothetical protein RJD38_22195 (plasmid) [Vibrio scophthalmi]|jgi:hypothetical protein|uniref:helix-turn-helix transcriptional regulator n=1 Tax=Vibrio scophthalmi TaxID=45658 RepID=UPI00349F698D